MQAKKLSAKKRTKDTVSSQAQGKTCACGLVHYGYYGEECAVCVVLERVKQAMARRRT